jgi:hypothetical protein
MPADISERQNMPAANSGRGMGRPFVFADFPPANAFGGSL